MNNIRSTAKLNARELELGGKGSWHDEFKESAYIYIGGLDTGLTEGDVITIFSQYGEPVDINLPRDKQTQKPRGFGFLMYEDQRSTNLAVDNLNGAVVLGRTLRVDHVKNYKQLERGEDGKMKERDAARGESLNALPELHMPKEQEEGVQQSEGESYGSIDPEDPMASYLLEERKKAKKDSKGKKRKQEGETKEERRARKDAKRLKKLLKEVGPPTGRDSVDKERRRVQEGERRPRRYEEDGRRIDEAYRRDRSPRRSRYEDDGRRDRSQTPPHRRYDEYDEQLRNRGGRDNDRHREDDRQRRRFDDRDERDYRRRDD